jgi:lysophospholipase L1-like esterase
VSVSESRKRLALVLVSGAFAFLLFALVFEVVENVKYERWKRDYDNFGWFGEITVASSNVELMWEYRPYGAFENIRTNRYGFRDEDYESEEKPRGVYRIAFVGDSVTLGLGVDAEETFVARFQVLAERSLLEGAVQAMNFGVDGYNAVQIHELLVAKVARFSPDDVVYAMSLNDFDLREASGKKVRYFRKPKSFFTEAMERAYRYLFRLEYHRYFFEKNQQMVFDYVLRMKRFADREGIGFQVAILPIFPWDKGDFDDYELADVNARISAHLMDHGVRCLDLLDAFRQQGRAPGYFTDQSVWHPNAKGHAIIANAAFRELEQRIGDMTQE